MGMLASDAQGQGQQRGRRVQDDGRGGHEARLALVGGVSLSLSLSLSLSWLVLSKAATVHPHFCR